MLGAKLTLEEREVIFFKLVTEELFCEIAEHLEHPASTVRRERGPKRRLGFLPGV